MSYIARGYTFTDGVIGDYTSTHLHQLVDLAAVTAISLTEFGTLSHVVQVGSAAPAADQGDGSLWMDSALGVLRQKNANARWDCPYVGPQMQNLGVTIPKGAWVTVSADATIVMCATGMWPEVLGVAMATLASGASGLIAHKAWGATMVPALLVGPITIGDALISAGHNIFAWSDGYARALKATGVSAATMGTCIGMSLASVASGVTALGSVIPWR